MDKPHERLALWSCSRAGVIFRVLLRFSASSYTLSFLFIDLTHRYLLHVIPNTSLNFAAPQMLSIYIVGRYSTLALAFNSVFETIRLQPHWQEELLQHLQLAEIFNIPDCNLLIRALQLLRQAAQSTNPSVIPRPGRSPGRRLH